MREMAHVTIGYLDNASMQVISPTLADVKVVRDYRLGLENTRATH